VADESDCLAPGHSNTPDFQPLNGKQTALVVGSQEAGTEPRTFDFRHDQCMINGRYDKTFWLADLRTQ